MQSSTFSIVCLLVLAVFSSCTPTKEPALNETVIQVQNPLEQRRQDVLLSLDMNEVAQVFDVEVPENLNFTMPYQFNDNDMDGAADELLLLMNLAGGEQKTLSPQELLSESKQSFPKRTQAEISHKINGTWQAKADKSGRNEYVGGAFRNVDRLRVPEEHSDHSWYIRYEGPGWESDKVGYRFYLDWRNATDIFGKKTTDMVLQQVGQDGFDSYHEPSDWGMDVLKVGSSLGIGAIGMWVDDKAVRVEDTEGLESMIVSNGIIQSRVRTIYSGWTVNDQQLDLTADLTINAGSRLTLCSLSLSDNAPNLCTGIVKAENAELITQAQQGVSGWGYIATYGPQSLAEDNLGMVVFFKNEDLIEVTEDAHSHVVVLMPKHKSLEYYFAACWEQEPGGITSKEAFVAYLDAKLAELNEPVLLEVPQSR